MVFEEYGINRVIQKDDAMASDRHCSLVSILELLLNQIPNFHL